MITREQRIPVPDDPIELIDLGMKVYARHCVMGDKSPLFALTSNSWEENGFEINNAMRINELIEEDTNPPQSYFLKRDELVSKIKASIQSSHDLLSDIYHDNPEELGFWGFDIEKMTIDESIE